MKRIPSLKEYTEAFKAYDQASQHLAIVLWRVCTETLGQQPHGQERGRFGEELKRRGLIR